MIASSSCTNSCKRGVVDLPDAAQSPQASAEPAPLANLLATTTSAGPDAGPRPELLRTDRPLPIDTPHENTQPLASREPARESKELAGYSLQAALRAGEGPTAPKAPEINISAIEAAKRKTETRIAIDVSQTRARFVLSAGFVLPPGTELRARADRYGHLLFMPDERTYRVVEPGALRAVLGERRMDVAPLSPATVATVGEGPRRLGLRTRRAEVSTRAAKAVFELASIRDIDDGGALVCRLLLDLMNAPPSTDVCAVDELPLHVEFRWTTQGAATFDVLSMLRRVDLPAQELAAPPPLTSFEPRPLPALAGEALLSKADLASFRTAAIEAAPPSMRDAQGSAVPEAGLILVNSSDELRVAWIDGVAVGWVAPGGRQWLSSLLRGRYVLQWRTFLGDAWESPHTVVVPGSSDVGSMDQAPH